MGIIKKMRRQKAVWWRRIGTDEFGKPIFDGPVEISCRWEDDAREFVMQNGEKTVSRSIVYVDREMSPGDRLRLGQKTPVEPHDPLQLDNTFEIRRFEKIPNLRNTEVLYVALL